MSNSAQNISPDFILARTALLDVLELLVDQIGGFVLVGAQAIYLHAPADQVRQPTSTTDSDLAIDPNLLSENPDIGAVLIAAGYMPHSSPGTYYSPSGIQVDLMVPDGMIRQPGRRTAPLSGQSKATARRTAGIELALVDSERRVITALESSDSRQTSLKIAGPAALVVAKLYKLQERLEGGRIDRVIPKDASDLLRLLRYCDAGTIGRRLADISRTFGEPHAAIITRTLQFLRDDLAGSASILAELAADDLDSIEPRPQVTASMIVLGTRLFDAYDSSIAN